MSKRFHSRAVLFRALFGCRSSRLYYFTRFASMMQQVFPCFAGILNTKTAAQLPAFLRKRRG
jgi:hypothetical protein